MERARPTIRGLRNWMQAFTRNYMPALLFSLYFYAQKNRYLEKSLPAAVGALVEAATVLGGTAIAAAISTLSEAALGASIAAAEVTLAAEAALSLSLAGNAVSLAADVDGAGLLLHLIKLGVIVNGFALVQRLETLGVDLGEVHKHVLTTVHGRDEAIALLAVEEFDGSLLSHFVSLKTNQRPKNENEELDETILANLLS